MAVNTAQFSKHFTDALRDLVPIEKDFNADRNSAFRRVAVVLDKYEKLMDNPLEFETLVDKAAERFSCARTDLLASLRVLRTEVPEVVYNKLAVSTSRLVKMDAGLAHTLATNKLFTVKSESTGKPCRRAFGDMTTSECTRLINMDGTLRSVVEQPNPEKFRKHKKCLGKIDINGKPTCVYQGVFKCTFEGKPAVYCASLGLVVTLP